MPVFHYKARQKDGHSLINGTIEATNEQDAVKKLRGKGLLILSVGASLNAPFGLSNLNIFRRIVSRDRILFTRQFAVMMRAGLPIVPALKAIEDQTTNRTLRQTIVSLTRDVEGGMALSQAFGQYPRAFPPIFVSVARVGEKSGQLEEVLERLATQLEKDDELVSKIRSAMIYPAFVFVALIAVMILIMVFIIPQLKGLFEDVGAELPFITRTLLLLSDLMRRYILIWLTVLGGLIIGVRLASHYSKRARYSFEQIRLRTPVFGKLYRQMMMARFSHTLGTLLAAGLPLLEAIKTTAVALNSATYTQALERMSHSIESGQPLSESLLASKEFPSMVGHMLSIGEKSGKMDEVLETVAGFYDRDVETLTRNLSASLEPILMLVMGLGVGLVVASVIQPIYGLVNAI